MEITNSSFINKLRSYYSRTSALDLEVHCTNCFQRVMCISCRRHVDVHKGEGSVSCGQGDQNFIVDLNKGNPVCKGLSKLFKIIQILLIQPKTGQKVSI